jgi:hypothetical protein
MANLTLEQVRNSSAGRVAAAVKIIFPAYDSFPQLTKRIGTHGFNVDFEDYEDRLVDAPTIRESSGSSVDGADFTVEDAAGDFYDEISDYEDVVEDAEVIIKECFEVTPQVYRSEVNLIGYLSDFVLDDTQRVINFSSVEDIYRTGSLIGGRILTMRYCLARFNVNGILSPLIDPCGWQTVQGGNALECDHTYNGDLGCVHHNNGHRYFAVEALYTAPITIVPGTGTGWTYGSGGCFSPNTPIPLWNGKTKPIYKVRKGDVVVSFNQRGERVPGKVLLSEKHLFEYVLRLEFFNGPTIETTLEHLVHVGSNYYRPAGVLEPGDVVNFRTTEGTKLLTLKKGSIEQRRTYVYGIDVHEYHNYMVGEVSSNDKIWMEVHNRKSEFPTIV